MPSPIELEKTSSNSLLQELIVLEKLGIEYIELLLRGFPGQTIKMKNSDLN